MVASSVATVVLVGSLLAAPALAAPIHSRASSSDKFSSGSSVQGAEKILGHDDFEPLQAMFPPQLSASNLFNTEEFPKQRSPPDIVETIPTFDLPLATKDRRSLKGDLAGSAPSSAANAAVTQLIQGVEKILPRSPLDITETIPTFDIPLESELDRRSNSLELPNGLSLKDLFARDMDLD